MNATIIAQQAADIPNEYRYKRFTTSLLFRDLRFAKDAAGPGDPFPSFELVTTDGNRLVNSDVFGAKPALVIFGSMTCPMTASAAPSVQELYDEFGERIRFIMLYVREAHPGENFTQSETMDEKLEHARALKDFYDIHWTVAADNVDGDLHRALDPKPNSAYLTNNDGTILFRSLWASDYGALSEAMDAAANQRTPETKQSTRMIGPVVRAMGHVQEAMTRSGPQAVRDLWRAGFPMAMAGRIATLFTPLSPDQRGIAAVITLAFGMLATISLLIAWAVG